MTSDCLPDQWSGVRLPHKQVLRNVDFHVPVGAVMGMVARRRRQMRLIKAMLGLVTPLTGHSEFFDQPLARVRQKVGYMPQSASVDWDFLRTVRDVVLMGTYGRSEVAAPSAAR